MTSTRSPDYDAGLVRELVKLPRETEWVEFKANNSDPKEIGEYLSALSNSAALADKAHAYLIWGVHDATHELVGTTFVPRATKIGNEELENWLLKLLTPKLEFRFAELDVDGRRIVLLETQRAMVHPVKFQGDEFIRVGSYKKPLKNHPEKERALWRALDHADFEDGVAAEKLDGDEVLKLLDYPAYFALLDLPLPHDRPALLNALAADNLINPCPAGGWNISHLGAMLFARDLSAFPLLARKAVRVVAYRGPDRLNAERERVEPRGYACGFESIIQHVMALLPATETIDHALRRSIPAYPEPAVREVVANALLHQDFAVRGAGPMVEIFEGRVEITNPGAPLVDTERFLDCPPRSRNEALASMMRRLSICEERGTGIDKVVAHLESQQLPAPLFEIAGDNTRVVLFARRRLADMDQPSRLRACYLHACLRFVRRGYLTNASLRERFGIEQGNRAVASRIIRDAIRAGLIAADDPAAAQSQMRYLPWWAARKATT